MAQSGYTPILTYGSTTASNTPLAANLITSASGVELAINAADGKLFYKDTGGVVQVIASKDGSSGTFSNVTITGGTINNTVIGGTTRAAGSFTTMTLTTPLAVLQGGTGSTTASGARSNLSAAASGANSDITSLIGLTTPLSVGQGGTGVATSTGSGSVVLSVSPTFTGNPTAPTATTGTNTTQIATTAFVQASTGALGTMASQNASAVAITGGTITGTTVNGNVVGTNAVGARTISTSSPVGGSSGDIWYKV
jgi:hypothetical protein